MTITSLFEIDPSVTSFTPGVGRLQSIMKRLAIVVQLKTHNLVLGAVNIEINKKLGAAPSLSFIAGFLLGAIVVGSSWLSTREANVDVVHDVTIDYMYEYEPKSASGHKSLAVQSIEFRPGFIVVTETNGTTRLFSLDRMRHFSYSPTESS